MNVYLETDASRDIDGNPNGGTAERPMLIPPSIRQRSVGWVFSSILRMLSASWRVDIRGAEVLDQLADANSRHLLAFWHRHYITMFRLLHARPIVVVTNQSQRGQVIADICHRNGMRTLQVGEKGRKAMFESIARATNDGYGLGIAVDGPLGPVCKVKRVVAHLATRLDCPVVPIFVVARNKYIFKNRWDGLEIPYPFSRISFVIGNALDFSTLQAGTTTSEQAIQLQHAIEELAQP